MDNRNLRRRIRKAFRELEKDGVVCRENFACCSTCAATELFDLIDQEKSLGGIYWHSQDEGHLRESGDVAIGFISNRDDDNLQAGVGRRAAQAFKEAGLGVRWDGNPRKRIIVFCKSPARARKKRGG